MRQIDTHQKATDSDTNDSISLTNLSPLQAQVVAELAVGRSISAAARQAGIHRATVHKWLNHDPGFKAAVQNAQAEYVAAINDQMCELSSCALKTLYRLLASDDTPAVVQLKTALAVLQRPRLPEPVSRQDETIPAPILRT